MRYFGIVFSLFFIGNLWANVGLPSVNTSKSGVSARALFGAAEKIPQPQKKVIARTVNTSGESDLLIPKRPTENLWVKKADAPIRMPSAEEFKTVKIATVKETLPEEFIDKPKKKEAVVDTFVIDSKIEKMIKETRDQRPEISKSEKNNSELRTPNSELSKLSPSELKAAFKKTYLADNKHLSTYQIDGGFDVPSDETVSTAFDSSRDLSETGGVRPLEIKISFRGQDSALSRENFTLLAEYASIVASNPKRAIQISIPERMANSLDGRRLTARRLSIIEQSLRDNGISDHRMMPVLSGRDDDSIVLRIISNDLVKTMTREKRDMFGDVISSKSSKSLSW